MKNLFLPFIFIFLISIVSASCESGQIDINTASASELDDLHGIGPAKAENIIAARPFDSIDDLIRANGIGEVTLSNIKSQELACVNGEEKEEQSEEIKNESSLVNTKTENSVENLETSVTNQPERETIILNPKVIKTENNKEFSEENNNYAIYGFVAFSVLIVALFLLRKNKYKNEFA